MTIESPAFEPNGPIPPRYTCDGDDVNPPLVFRDVPKDARSLVLIMEDPDVPPDVKEDGLWNHWVLWNIPPEMREIPEDATELPCMVGRNTRGIAGYGGPCPPDREHRYFFRLYALDTMLNDDPKVTRSDLDEAMTGHILAEAELMGRYDRQRT